MMQRQQPRPAENGLPKTNVIAAQEIDTVFAKTAVLAGRLFEHADMRGAATNQDLREVALMLQTVCRVCRVMLDTLPADPPADEKKQTASTATKQELQDTLNEVSAKVLDMLDAKLTRRELVVLAEELDALINGTDDNDQDDDE